MSSNKLIDADELIALEEAGKNPLLLDIREDKELNGELDFFKNAHHIPMNDVDPFDDFFEAHQDEDIILVCHSGNRAGALQTELEDNGVENTRVLLGGILRLGRVMREKKK